MRVLGIDPGLGVTGYACLEGLGALPRIVEAGVFRLKASAKGAGAESVSARLVELDRDFEICLSA